MNFNLDPVTGMYRLGFPYGYLRTEKTSTRKSGTTVVVSFTPEGTTRLFQAKATNELKEKVTELSALIDSFEFPEGNDPKLFRTATASETDKVSIEAESGAEIKTHQLDIETIAQSKTFKSKVLSSNAETSLSEGTHTFEIEKNGTIQSVDIYVDRSAADPDTNRDVFNKLALAINEADSDLEAEVVETERKVYSTLSDNLYEDVSYLKVSTKETGDSIDFILQDDSGTIVNDLKLDQNIQAGSTASYVLNEVAAESDSNSVTADNGKLDLELLDVTDETVTIEVETGAGPALNQITEIVSSHNDYVNFLDENQKYIDSGIKNSLITDLKEIKFDLSQIGLMLNADGTLDVTDKFERSFENSTETVRNTLVGTEGLFPVISEDLDEVSAADTSAYATNKTDGLFSIIAKGLGEASATDTGAYAANKSFSLGSLTFSLYF